MTTEEKVEALRDKLADKQNGLNTYLAKGEFSAKWYKHGLQVQEATFDYVLRQLNEILDTEPQN